MTGPASQTMTRVAQTVHSYPQSEIDRLADVMTDYADKVFGSYRRQDAQAAAIVNLIQGGMFDTGNLVRDWAEFVLWNISGQYHDKYERMREYLTPLLKDAKP